MSNGEDELPSAGLIAELAELLQEADKQWRVLAAWQIVNRGRGHSDFPVLTDFALEHELILSCEVAHRTSSYGRETRCTSWVNPIDGSEMIWIPPGPFVVGPKNQPAQCQGFSLARFPVTNAQFRRFVQATSYQPPVNHPDPELFWNADDAPDDHPAVWVSLIDALAYCRWAGLTLPTEWLWEKAARGPEGRRFPWGDEMPWRTTTELIHVNASDTCAVGRFPRTRTPFGCEDLIGNVSEWCLPLEGEDFGVLPDTVPAIPLEPMTEPFYAPVRGSCFLRTNPVRMTAAHRRRLSATRRNQWAGFRPAFFGPWRPA